MDNFKSEKDAFECAEELVTQNCADFQFEFEKIDHPMPKLVKFKYVIGHGTKRSWSSKDTTSVEGTFEPKTKKAVEDLGGAWQALTDGAGLAPPSAAGAGAKVESPVLEELKKTAEATRSAHLT